MTRILVCQFYLVLFSFIYWAWHEIKANKRAYRFSEKQHLRFYLTHYELTLFSIHMFPKKEHVRDLFRRSVAAVSGIDAI